MEKLKSKDRIQPTHVRYPEPDDHSSNRVHPSNHHYETYSKVGDSESLAYGKLAVHDPIMQKQELDRRTHDPSHLLLDNDFLS